MTALYLLIYVICAYNVSFWLVFSEGLFGIFDKFRDFVERVSPQLRKALDCMNCTPTWCGMFASILNMILLPSVPLTPFHILLNGHAWWGIIIALDAIFTSGAVYLVHTFQEMMERIGNNNE